ncbi:hypothetical protein Lsan_1873 [Legionella santicrucis]|uniref:Substrate of the Dot/Icm secretion system n=1 Tax=Legionella santicrucis TaxID=45074 RepID=A0A0W0YXC6_9GAMM|nr:hypothetical protein [Legionella santicrucis]KTD61311.1 hypothetical protein Lsan_1873 [Legionella santicrucis]
MATTQQDIQKLNEIEAQKQKDNQQMMEQAQATRAANNQEMLNPNQEIEQNTKNMDVKKDPNKNHDLEQICQDWLKKYKKQKPDFNEDENKLKVDEDNGRITLQFKNTEAEEDFLRYLAKQGVDGKVSMGGDVIALTKNGELIDPRTNKAFPEGGYKELVDQLRAGKNYNDLPIPTSSENSPKFVENSPTPKPVENSSKPVENSPDLPLSALKNTPSFDNIKSNINDFSSKQEGSELNSSTNQQLSAEMKGDDSISEGPRR